MKRHGMMQCGVSLIELLVSIGVISVLISLAAPALLGVRESAGEVKSLANLHSIGLSFEAYAAVNKQQYPFPPSRQGPTSSSVGFGPIVLDPGGALGPSDVAWVFFAPIWQMDRLWPGVMHQVAPWSEHYATWLSPGLLEQVTDGDADPWSVAVSYQYCHSFLANPHVWSGASAVDESLIGPAQTSDVAYPSAKVLLFDADRSYLQRGPRDNDPRPVAFTDGSAAARRDSDATAPVQNALSTHAPSRYHDTPRGALGRDF